MIKKTVKDLLGKTISGVVVKRGRDPEGQIYLVFDDNTYYEFWSQGEIHSTGRIEPGGMAEVKARGEEKRFEIVYATDRDD